MFKRKSFHLTIAMKAVLLFAALDLLSIAANWFVCNELDEVDRRNAVVARHLAPARLALAEAKTAIESFGVATYKTYATDDADQSKRVSRGNRRLL